MGGRRRRAARRVCLSAAAACLALGLGVPAGAQDEDVAARPEVYRGKATAQVASVEVDRDALLPIDDLFRVIALDGASIFETDLQTARASLLFPGNGLILGPSLLCGTFGGQFPPELKPVLDTCLQYDYPLSVKADASTPDRATSGSLTLGRPTDPVSGDAVAARAHADADRASSFAALQDLRVLGLPGFGPITLLPLQELELDTSVLTVGSATSETSQRIEGGVLIVDSAAELSDVRLVGGLVHIGSIRSTSHATDDGAGARTAEALLEVTGVTVAGIPAQITHDGLVLGSPSGSTGPLQQQLQTVLSQLLDALHVRITLLDTEEQADDGTGQAVASAGGLLVEVATEAQGLPNIPGPLGDIDPNGTYVGSIQLGTSAAAAGASSFGAEEPLPDEPSFDGGAGIVDEGGSFDPGPVDLGLPPADVPEAPAGQNRPPAPPTLVRDLTDPFGGRMGLLYLAFMFTVLGLCITPRLAVPARLPGARP